jgi:uncharacterized protein YciI
MKLLNLFAFVCILSLTYACQAPVSNKSETNHSYNKELAVRLKADQYGMSRYVMAFLKRGPNRSQDSVTAANLQKAHMENITRMAEEGTLVLAGPFLDDGDIRGIYIFNVATIEEAKKLTESDPAIKAGRLVMELHPWYGSAAVKEINAIHNQLTKE